MKTFLKTLHSLFLLLIIFAAIITAFSGVGITHVLHYQVAEAIKQGQLDIVLEAFEADPAPVHLLHASRGRMPLKMRSFLDFAVPRFREKLNEIALS